MVNHTLLALALLLGPCDRWGHKKEEGRARQAVSSEIAVEKARAVKELQAALDKQVARVDSLAAEMAKERDEHKRRVLLAQLEAAEEEANDTRGRLKLPPVAATSRPSAAPTACACKATDPLCDCL